MADIICKQEKARGRQAAPLRIPSDGRADRWENSEEKRWGGVVSPRLLTAPCTRGGYTVEKVTVMIFASWLKRLDPHPIRLSERVYLQTEFPNS